MEPMVAHEDARAFADCEVEHSFLESRSIQMNQHESLYRLDWVLDQRPVGG